MSSNQYEVDADRLAYERLLQRNAWGRDGGVVSELVDAIQQARERTSQHGAILSREEMIERLQKPTEARAREMYRQALMKLVTRQRRH